MTAHALKGDRERCLEAGMDGYVSKPIQARLLFEAIEKLAPAPAPEPTPASVVIVNEKLPTRVAVPKAKAHEKIFDKEAALAMIDGDTALFGELIGLFMTESDELLNQVQEAITQRNAKLLERAAHSLKGSVAAFSAESARRVAQTLETIGAHGDLDRAETVASDLREKVVLLTSALVEYRKESVACES